MEEDQRLPLLSREILESRLEEAKAFAVGRDRLGTWAPVGDTDEGLFLLGASRSDVALAPSILGPQSVEGDVPRDTEEPGAEGLPRMERSPVLEGAPQCLVRTVLNIRVVLRSPEHARDQCDNVGSTLGKGFHRSSRKRSPGGARRVGAS